mgnify:CR=1 FL=1
MCTRGSAVAGGAGKPRLGVGASGGRRILASVVQMEGFEIDGAMTREQAAHQPRIEVSGETGIAIEADVPADLAAELLTVARTA